MIIKFNTKKFTNLLKTLNQINTETRLKVYNWKLESVFVDSSNIALLDLMIDIREFGEIIPEISNGNQVDYYNKLQDKKFWDSLTEDEYKEVVFPVDTILKTFIPTVIEDELFMEIVKDFNLDKNEDCFYIRMFSDSSDVSYSLDVDFCRKNAHPPQHEYKQGINIDKKQIAQMVKTVSAFKKLEKRIAFKTFKNELKVISVDEDLVDGATVKFAVDNDEDNEQVSMFLTEYINDIVKTAKPLFDELKYEFMTDLPCKISGNKDGLYITYMVAPMIETRY